MRFIQPYPDHASAVVVPPERRVRCRVPVYHVRYRYPHHAAHSGYDPLCDWCGETIRLPRRLYWLGETLLRPVALASSRLGGHFEYSRYDWVMEEAAIRHFLRHRDSVYHFIYGEKSFKRLAPLAGRNGNRIVLTVHHPPEHHDWLFRSLDHFRAADRLVVVSSDLVPWWEGVVGAGRVTFVPLGVDADYFAPPSAPPPADAPVCLFAGQHERDFDALDRVVAAVTARHPGVRFVLITSHARAGAIAAARPRTTWHRRVGEAEYLAAMRGATVFLIPMTRSTANDAVLEALACGVPVVSNAGGVQDYLDERSGLVFPVGDADGMAEAVLGLLADPARRAAFSRGARERALAFAWPRIAERTVQVYEEVAGVRSA